MKHLKPASRLRLLATAAWIGMAFVHADPSAAMNRPTSPPQSVAATSPASAEAGWWRSFNDPLLDRLVQGVFDADDSATESGGVVRAVTHYVEAHWLTAKLALAQDLTQVLTQKRHWAASEGPTDTAAKAINELDRAIEQMKAELHFITYRRDQVLTALRSIKGYSDSDEAELKQSLMMPTLMARFDLQRWATMPNRHVLDGLAQQAAQVRQLEQVALGYAERFEAQRKALEVGNNTERAALQAYESMLLAADQALQAEAALAMAWVRAWDGAEGASSSP